MEVKYSEYRKDKAGGREKERRERQDRGRSGRESREYIGRIQKKEVRREEKV